MLANHINAPIIVKQRHAKRLLIYIYQRKEVLRDNIYVLYISGLNLFK